MIQTAQRQKRLRTWLENSGWYLVLTLFAIVTAMPFLWTALMSLRQTSANVFSPNKPPQVIAYPGLIGWGAGAQAAQSAGRYEVSAAEATDNLPAGYWVDYTARNQAALEGTWREPYSFPATTLNYYNVWTGIQIPRYFLNSLFVALTTVLLNVITCSLAAYPLAKIDFRGRNAIFTLILATLVFPPQLLMIPLYIMAVNVFQFNDTYWALILPFGTSAFGVFLLRQIYESIPNELLEAARLDGATEFGIWWRVLLPLIRPGIATLAIVTFVNAWNDFLWPLLMLSNRDLFTLPVGLSFLRGFFSGNIRSVAAGIVVATVPMIIFFLIFQRQFIRGLSGAVKG
jgi:putative chitobiose transport system permease protein